MVCIPEGSFERGCNKNSDSQSSGSSQSQHLYWKEVEAECDLYSHNVSSYYKRIDRFWRHTDRLGDEKCVLK